MKRHKDDAFSRPAEARWDDDRPSRRGDPNTVALAEPESLGVPGRQLGPGFGGGGFEFWCAARFRARMEVVDGSAGRESERVVASSPTRAAVSTAAALRMARPSAPSALKSASLNEEPVTMSCP